MRISHKGNIEFIEVDSHLQMRVPVEFDLEDLNKMELEGGDVQWVKGRKQGKLRKRTYSHQSTLGIIAGDESQQRNKSSIGIEKGVKEETWLEINLNDTDIPKAGASTYKIRFNINCSDKLKFNYLLTFDMSEDNPTVGRVKNIRSVGWRNAMLVLNIILFTITIGALHLWNLKNVDVLHQSFFEQVYVAYGIAFVFTFAGLSSFKSVIELFRNAENVKAILRHPERYLSPSTTILFRSEVSHILVPAIFFITLILVSQFQILTLDTELDERLAYYYDAGNGTTEVVKNKSIYLSQLKGIYIGVKSDDRRDVPRSVGKVVPDTHLFKVPEFAGGQAAPNLVTGIKNNYFKFRYKRLGADDEYEFTFEEIDKEIDDEQSWLSILAFLKGHKVKNGTFSEIIYTDNKKANTGLFEVKSLVDKTAENLIWASSKALGKTRVGMLKLPNVKIKEGDLLDGIIQLLKVEDTESPNYSNINMLKVFEQQANAIENIMSDKNCNFSTKDELEKYRASIIVLWSSLVKFIPERKSSHQVLNENELREMAEKYVSCFEYAAAFQGTSKYNEVKNGLPYIYLLLLIEKVFAQGPTDSIHNAIARVIHSSSAEMYRDYLKAFYVIGFLDSNEITESRKQFFKELPIKTLESGLFSQALKNIVKSKEATDQEKQWIHTWYGNVL